ncbi:MAG: esterase family protein [Sphingobacteriales bacterium]|nr:esterase family protein [Sphingobacteriales bacterium]
MKRLFALLLSIITTALSFAQLPVLASGTLKRQENFPSVYVTPRTVDVWLPDGYTFDKKYNVLYMHDGQMLFDSGTTWNKQAWDAEDVIASLLKEKKIKDLILVGIWSNGETRHADYFPQKAFELLTKTEQDSIYAAGRSNGAAVFNNHPVQSDKYLQFLIKELKPFIDSVYSTYKDRSHTFIAGSSMGGLISLYAICEYPGIFGGAACLSTHWPGVFTMEKNPVPAAFLKYMEKQLPDPATHKIYFDYGTATLDALYPPLQQKADILMKNRGFTSRNWITREFPGEDHSEKAWHKRLHIPLTFLLGR